MTDLWVDANIILRLLTGEPPKQAQQSLRLFQRAELGEVSLKVSPLIVAEVIWVLISFYKYSRTEVANVLIPLLSTSGISLEDEDQVLAALDAMGSKNVDFADAFLAEIAKRDRCKVVSFDRDFKKLGADFVDLGKDEELKD